MTYVIDSSGWIDYFANEPKAEKISKYIQSQKSLLTPSLILYEVYKKIAREKTEGEAVFAITQIELQSEVIIPLDERLALFAADVSLRWKLAMADAIIYATALQEKATLVTSDHHFKGLEQVVLI